MLFDMFIAVFQSSVASKNASSLSGSMSMYFTFKKTFSIWNSGSVVDRRPMYFLTAFASLLHSPPFSLQTVVSFSQLASK